jgi:hypothetical protein
MTPATSSAVWIRVLPAQPINMVYPAQIDEEHDESHS